MSAQGFRIASGQCGHTPSVIQLNRNRAIVQLGRPLQAAIGSPTQLQLDGRWRRKGMHITAIRSRHVPQKMAFRRRVARRRKG